MTNSEVIQSIKEAWRDVPCPGDDKIFTLDSHDDENMVNYFAGTTWQNHTPEDLRAHSSAFTFFTPGAFHYWLPAFIIAAIQDPEEADVILQRIPWSLSDDYSTQRWPLFSALQRQAVANYLRYQIENFPDEAMDERKALAILEKQAH